MKIKAYQICYSPETLASVPDGFHVLDYTDNSRPDWREFWPIRQFLINNQLSDSMLYGFFSPKFHQKTCLNFNLMQEFINNNYDLHDVVSFSPFWDLSSIFKNIFEQGDFFHPGLLNVCQIFANKHLTGLDLSNVITHSQNNIFCNFFLGTKCFWEKWLAVSNHLLHAADSSSSDLYNDLNKPTTYGVQRLPMKVFVQERLATLIILNNKNLSMLAYDTFLMPCSTTPFNQFFNEAVTSDALKIAYSKTNNNVYLNSFSNLRNELISANFQI